MHPRVAAVCLPVRPVQGQRRRRCLPVPFLPPRQMCACSLMRDGPTACAVTLALPGLTSGAPSPCPNTLPCNTLP